MYPNSRPKIALTLLLAFSLVTTGCSPQWIKAAMADLPVLVQMALNIGTMVTTLQSGKQLNSSEAAAIQNLSNEASRDLNLLQTLYNQYKASPSADTMQKIQDAISGINQNLPALLRAAHVSDPSLAARVTAAVNLILATVNSFATLLPPARSAVQAASLKRAIPHPEDLKKQWNQQICGPTGKAALDSSLNICPIR